MEIDSSLPLVIHALRFSPGAPGLELRPELARGAVFSQEGEVSRGRETVSASVRRLGALAGVNADFFPFTGDPLGAMMRDGVLKSRPFPNRPAFVWGEGYATAATLTMEASVRWEGQEPIRIFGINEECGNNMIVLNTADAGYAISREPATHVLLDLDGPIAPNQPIRATYRWMIPESSRVPITPGQAVLTMRGPMTAAFTRLERGAELTLQFNLGGADFSRAKHVVGGGSFLVRNGVEFLDHAEAGFNREFSDLRNPRTAMGVTAEGDIWLVTVDGRQSSSVGATLRELSRIMIRLGCVTAINLDGGGSTTINLLGTTVNRPSEGTERAIANGIFVFGDPVWIASTDGPSSVAVRGRPQLQAGERFVYELVGPDGTVIPHSEVIWSATGEIFVDQAGVVRGLRPGAGVLTALYRGQATSVAVTVVPAPNSNGR